MVKMSAAIRVLGLMSGTSMDGVDAAIIETDGERVTRVAGSLTAFAASERAVLEAAVQAALVWRFDGPEPMQFAPARATVTQAYIRAASAMIAAHGPVDMIGAHGQTVLHRAPANGTRGATCQLIDPSRLASACCAPVWSRFREADMAAGGQGAPLAPVYHRAMLVALGQTPPAGVLNLGGVANLTMWQGGDALFGFDTGPASMLMDRWCQAHGRGDFDAGGQGAAGGKVDEAALLQLMAHPYLKRPGPKSLDRHDFDLTEVDGLDFADGLATLTAFAARSIAMALMQAGFEGKQLIVVGGGVHNTTLMDALRAETGIQVTPADVHGWSADWLEAELMAYCAVRAAKGLPLTYPGTTGIGQPLTGGVRSDP